MGWGLGSLRRCFGQLPWVSPIRGDTHLSGSLERSTGDGIDEGRGGVVDGAAPRAAEGAVLTASLVAAFFCFFFLGVSLQVFSTSKSFCVFPLFLLDFLIDLVVDHLLPTPVYGRQMTGDLLTLQVVFLLLGQLFSQPN